MKISSLYGMPVISKQGKRGYVLSVNATEGKLQCLICADENENEFIIDFKDVLSVKNCVKFTDRASEIKNSLPVRLGKPAYDKCGNFLGFVTDMEFSNGKITGVRIGRKKYDADCAEINDAAIISDFKKVLKSDVEKDGKVIIKKGTVLTDEVLKRAFDEGEYVQANLKCI